MTVTPTFGAKIHVRGQAHGASGDSIARRISPGRVCFHNGRSLRQASRAWSVVNLWGVVMFRLCCVFVTALLSTVLPPLAQAAVDYDIVYVRQLRYGDNLNTIWPEVTHPGRAEPGADLMLLHPDGSEEVLVAGGDGAVTDPFLSFDAQWVYYAYFHDLRPQSLNTQREHLSFLGSDIFRVNLQSREIQQLTFGEFTPNTAAGIWDESNPLDPPSQFNRLGFGVLNLGPSPLPGGRVAFTSSRNAFDPPRGNTKPTLQLYVMDDTGDNVEQTGHMNLGSALHPTVLRDGRLLFSTLESQGLRGGLLWGIWSIFPDGRQWAPFVSAFTQTQSFHFMTQLSNGDVVVTDYYNANNNGFGALYRLPAAPPAGEPAFHDAFAQDNDHVLHSTDVGGVPYTRPITIAFTPKGMHSLTPFTTGTDFDAPTDASGEYVGKFTHPSGAPGGDLLTVWTPGPANHRNGVHLPAYDGGLYLVPGAQVIQSPQELVLIKNDPAFNEAWPRAVVPYAAIHGVAEPQTLPWLPNDGTVHGELPAGSPFALIGASTIYKRESFPGRVTGHLNTFDGLDPFNTYENDPSSNFVWQGGDAGKYDNSDIWAIRIVAMEPNTDRSYGPQDIFDAQFRNFAGERLRILGEIPLRKFDEGGTPVLDPEGNPDTSFLVKLPADTPFTFQTLDRNAMVLNVSQTWHQLRPGEVRTDCGGCHAHSQAPLAFAQTAAAAPDYEIFDLGAVTPLLTHDLAGEPALNVVQTPLVDVEFYRDIRPLLEQSCSGCHDASAPGNLVLDDHSLYGMSQYPTFDVPGDYARLAFDSAAQWGHPPVIQTVQWRQTNASRYVRQFQSRRSLLMWKLFGARLDGWSNADHPTETVPGNAATLPPGTNPDLADLDYTGTPMPPPDTTPALSIDERMTFARWIDLGAPIEIDPTYGWFLDDLRPTVTVSTPRPGLNGTISALRFGLADANSGLDLSSLSVTGTFEVAGRPPRAELADLVSSDGDGIYTLFTGQLPPLQNAKLLVEVQDQQGNVTRVLRTFTTAADGDNDGVTDSLDNCLTAANADQRDTDADGFGNACDGDLNNDCNVDFSDLALLKAVFFSADPHADLDGDGTVNFADLGIMKAGFFAAPGPSASGDCTTR